MQMLPALLAIASLWFVAAVTPGPNFLLVLRVSALRTRADGQRAVLGIALGTCVWGLSGFFGVHALFLAAPVLYDLFRLCGGAYLIFFGARLLLNSFRHSAGGADLPRRPGWGAFRLGLATSLSNPKTALSVASIFAATLPSHPPVDLGLLAVGLMVTISAVWYSLMVRLFTTQWMSAAHRCLRRLIDRIAGAIFVAFGARLVLER